MCDKESLRSCKAYLRRRLAYGPPLVERESGESEEGAAGEQGASAWGHLWPLGRHVQCEELRRVRKGSISPLVKGFVSDFVVISSGISSHPPFLNFKNCCYCCCCGPRTDRFGYVVFRQRLQMGEGSKLLQYW